MFLLLALGRCLKGHLWHPECQSNWRSSGVSEVFQWHTRSHKWNRERHKLLGLADQTCLQGASAQVFLAHVDWLRLEFKRQCVCVAKLLSIRQTAEAHLVAIRKVSRTSRRHLDSAQVSQSWFEAWMAVHWQYSNKRIHVQCKMLKASFEPNAIPIMEVWEFALNEI